MSLTSLAPIIHHPHLLCVLKALPDICLWASVSGPSVAGLNLSGDEWDRHQSINMAEYYKESIHWLILTVVLRSILHLWAIHTLVCGHSGSVEHGLYLIIWASSWTSPYPPLLGVLDRVTITDSMEFPLKYLPKLLPQCPPILNVSTSTLALYPAHVPDSPCSHPHPTSPGRT